MTVRLLKSTVLLIALALVAGKTWGDVLAVDNGTTQVLRFSVLGAKSTVATANLDSPIGITLDASNNVYVVNNGATATSTFTNSVAKFSSTGTPLGFYVTPATSPGNTLNAPLGIASTQRTMGT